mmetsp:Transcript_30419/g.26941  ORF Transcript_30419/g.26941 Transcript_30419/m.26941 type:complete len:294 (+) Transcript_30419:316-1197(+)
MMFKKTLNPNKKKEEYKVDSLNDKTLQNKLQYLDNAMHTLETSSIGEETNYRLSPERTGREKSYQKMILKKPKSSSSKFVPKINLRNNTQKQARSTLRNTDIVSDFSKDKQRTLSQISNRENHHNNIRKPALIPQKKGSTARILLSRAKANIPRKFSQSKIKQMVPNIPESSLKYLQKFPELPKIMNRNNSFASLPQSKNHSKEAKALIESLRRPPSQARDLISLGSTTQVKVPHPVTRGIYTQRSKVTTFETKPMTSFSKRRKIKPNKDMISKLKKKCKRSAYTAFPGTRQR